MAIAIERVLSRLRAIGVTEVFGAPGIFLSP
jgi:hypothetical protein